MAATAEEEAGMVHVSKNDGRRSSLFAHTSSNSNACEEEGGKKNWGKRKKVRVDKRLEQTKIENFIYFHQGKKNRNRCKRFPEWYLAIFPNNNEIE